MAFPEKGKDMGPAGYKFSGDGICKYCKTPIEWWVTPRGKKIPMNKMETPETRAEMHTKTCTQSSPSLYAGPPAGRDVSWRDEG